MAGLLDLQNPFQAGQIGGLLGPDMQRQAAMQNVIGTLLGFGQGPSDKPLGFGTRMAMAARAGQQAEDASVDRSLKQALVGSQIGKLQQDAVQKAQVQRLFANGMPEDTVQNRMILTAAGMDADKIFGGQAPRPYGVGERGGVIAPRAGWLDTLTQTTAAEAVPKNAAEALASHFKFHPDIPWTAGGGTQPQGLEGSVAAPYLSQMLGRNPMGQGQPGLITGGQGTMQGPRGDAGMDRLDEPVANGMIPTGPEADRLRQYQQANPGPAFDINNVRSGLDDLTSPGGVTPNRVGGLPITNTADSAAPFQIPNARSRGFVAPSVPPATVYQSQQTQPDAFNKGKGEVYTKTFGGIQEGAAKAAAMEGSIAFMRNLNVQGGALTPFLSGLGGLAQAVGVDPKTVERLTGGVNVDNAQAFDASSKELIYNMLGSLGTGVSNADRSFVEAIVPTLRTTPGASQKLFDFMQAKIDWQKARWENAFNADMAQGSKDPYAPLKADREWKKANPFETWMKNAESYPALNAPKAAPAAPIPEAKPERMPNIPTFTSPNDPNLRLKPPGFQFYDPQGRLRMVPGGSAP